MGKLMSVPHYPEVLYAAGIPVGLCKNKTLEGTFQVAKIIKSGGSLGGEFEVLYEGYESDVDDFARRHIDEEYPGLLLRQ